MVKQQQVLDADALREKETKELCTLSTEFSGVRKLRSRPAIYDVTESDSNNVKSHGVYIGMKELLAPHYDRVKLVCNNNFIVATICLNGEKRNFLYKINGELVFNDFVEYRKGFFISRDFREVEKKFKKGKIKGLKVYTHNFTLLNAEYEIDRYEPFEKFNGENAIRLYPTGSNAPRVYTY